VVRLCFSSYVVTVKGLTRVTAAIIIIIIIIIIIRGDGQYGHVVVKVISHENIWGCEGAVQCSINLSTKC
jgi:hypothetical protein